MVAAANQGKIDLTKCWSVGDERVVHLSAIPANPNGAFTTAMDEQDVVWVLMNEGYENQEGISFVWGQKDVLNQKGRMNNEMISGASWNTMAMKTDLNTLYYNAIPATLRSIIKPHVTTSYAGSNTGVNQTTTEYISLFAEKEILGARSYSNAVEANALSQMEYYEVATNRIKYNADGTKVLYYLRSPMSESNLFCRIGSGGETSNMGSITGDYSIAPFGCI